MYTFKYKEVAEALHDALIFDPFIITIAQQVPGSASDKQLALTSYMDYSIIEAETYGRLFIPDDRYGASIWAIPTGTLLESEKSTGKQAFIKYYLGHDALAVWLTITNFMHNQLHGVITDDTWYLSLVGVNPALQGQGLGAGLITPVLKETDGLAVATYLETFNPKNISFYKRLGYEIALEVAEPVTGATYWVLVREPIINTTGNNQL
ncbi:MAG TPA: GNAT family N-acetyltransferase [Mucilaginibacter sp.]|jgi:GNAT superfamily N-acetyltransferase|nr:GNAT family N-acetyltransferase [Mucilaginibacter sp.]